MKTKSTTDRIEYRIKPSACVEGYYVHKCERNLLYSGISGKQRALFGLDKPSGSGGIVAAKAGEEWEKEVINRYIDPQSLHLKTEMVNGETSYLKYDEAGTLSELKKIVTEVEKDRERRYLYQGCLMATDAFRRKHFRFDEALYDGRDKGLLIDLTMTYPDLLRADWDPAEKRVVFSVVDIKLARRMKLAHKVQVALYVRLLRDTLDEYNKTAPETDRIRSLVNEKEGFLWNGGQEEERPFLLSDVDGLVDDYFNEVIPRFVQKLQSGIQNGTAGNLRNEVDRCVGQKCEWCENSSQCLKEMKDCGMMQVIPYLSAYAQDFAKEINAPLDITQFSDFVSDEENRKLLCSNRTWEYILSDGTTIEVQKDAFPFDRESIRNTRYKWKNVRSMTMPRWQDVSLIMTAQKYAGSGRVYALGIHVKEYAGRGDALPEGEELVQKWITKEEIFIAKDGTDEEYFRIITEFADCLFGILAGYHDGNAAERDRKNQKTLQGYVMDSYEMKNIEEVLYEILEKSGDDAIREKTMYILFWMQGEKLVEAGSEEPQREVEYPVIVAANELRKLVSLPLPVAYRLPDIIPAMNIGIKKEMAFNGDDYRDFFEIISDVMKSDVIHRVWTEKKTELIGDIRTHIAKRFYAEGNLIIKLQVEGGNEGHLVRRISPFFMPGRVGYTKELLKKWYFENRLEDLLAYHSIRSARLQGIGRALETGVILQMKVVNVEDREKISNGKTYYDRYVTLETDSLPEDFAGEWFSAVLAKEADIEDLYDFDDYRNRGIMPERFNTDTTAVLGFIEYKRDGRRLKMRGKILVKYSRYAISQEDVGDFVYVSDRFDNSFNSEKVERQLGRIEEGEGEILLDPASLEGIIAEDYPAAEGELLGFSSPDGYEFTPSQREAFRHLYENRLTVLQGPPGTGKTDFIARAVITLCRYEKNKHGKDLRVLVTANSHAAIENVLIMLDKKLGTDSDIKLYKLERFSDGGDVLGRIVRTEPDGSGMDGDDSPMVLGATNWGCWKMRGEVFDLIIIDEASQVRAMDAMLALCRNRQDSFRYLLVGDGDQLPAIIQGRYGIDSGTRSDYGSVFDFFRTKIRDNNLMLCENFRMNEVLLKYSAEKIYGEAYTSFNDEIKKRRLTYRRALQAEEWVSYILDGFSNEEKDSWPLVFCRIKDGTPYDQNRAEVMVATELVKAFREVLDCEDNDEIFWKGSEERDGVLGIVSPHHRHIEALKDAVRDATGMERESLLIDTVDKLQGQQREAVIVSYGVTDLESAVTEGEFIFNRNRLNVALTRAKCKSITIFSEILTKPSPDMLDTEDEDLQHGIEFVCGFHDFMKKQEPDTESDSRSFCLRLEDGGTVELEVCRKRMRVQ
ncbi:MAG: AAA family ATPase [Lachnospiraceae bacterium]|nr:AAA family ATPase [Lachnospiraceae bacterium]